MKGRYVFEVDFAGEREAGLHPYHDTVTVVVSSGDPGGDGGEFETFIGEALMDWFEGASVRRIPEEDNSVNVEGLTDDQLRAAVITHGHRMGSFAYYVAAEVHRCLLDRANVRAWRDTDGCIRAYYKKEEGR